MTHVCGVCEFRCEFAVDFLLCGVCISYQYYVLLIDLLTIFTSEENPQKLHFYLRGATRRA